MPDKIIRKLHELRRLCNDEPINMERFYRDSAYQAKVIADLERLVELEVQVTLESAEGEA